MQGSVLLFLTFLLTTMHIQHGSSSTITVPAFLWSSHHHRLSHYGVKEAVYYHTISLEDFADTVLAEGGWSNLLCSRKNLQHSVDVALVFIGKRLRSSDISRNKHVDQELINLLKVSFTRSNFSMAFPYVAMSEEKDTLEKSLMSVFTENCAHQSGMNDVAFLESCSIEGEGLTKLAGLHTVQDHVVSRLEKKQKEQTDLILFCSGDSQSSEEFDHKKSEGKILSELIGFLEQSGATYSVLYASDPYRSIQHHYHPALKRFLAEGTLGNGSGNSSHCDGLCHIKSSLLEGFFVGIVLLIILLSGLCCMMGIDTPNRFEIPQDS